MPIREINKLQRPAEYGGLADRLEAEWRHPSGAAQPDIVVEQLGTNQPVHLYVIWEDWRDLSLQERSELIMDVYERINGRDRAANVTIAMGLTQEEAERIVPSLVRKPS